MIDNQGKIKGRISIIDIIIVVAVLALGVGLAYRRATPHLQDTLRPEDTFYIVLEINRIRNVIVEDTVVVGDYVFRQHQHQALGTIVAVERHPATEILRRADGSALIAEMEDRYRLLITVRASGSIRSSGYFVNGNDHVAASAEIVLVNNRVFFPIARVHSISEESPL